MRMPLFALACILSLHVHAQKFTSFTWTSPGESSAASMPLGGGDIGLNVWAEKGDLLFYIAQSGTFDENNTMLKMGRVRLHVDGFPFSGPSFRQTLYLNAGYMILSVDGLKVRLWVDVNNSVVKVEAEAKRKTKFQASYESWRYTDRTIRNAELRQNSWKTPQTSPIITKADSFILADRKLVFLHANTGQTIMDATVTEQGLDSLQLYDPLKSRISGGYFKTPSLSFKENREGIYKDTDYRSWVFENSRPLGKCLIELGLQTGEYASIPAWNSKLKTLEAGAQKLDPKTTIAWWRNFWERSFIETSVDTINTNYKLFRYMLGCNSRGDWPTKFNGGLFTFDPEYVNKDYPYTPDFRLWGGGTFTAQNQRLVYQPMLRTGDFDLLEPQLNFYLNLLGNAEARTRHYWKHRGASFTEQLENFGLPNFFEYGRKRPASYDPGVEYNAWLNYQWETVLEFCQLMLDKHRYEGSPIDRYLPFIESCLIFFHDHYRQLQTQRDTQPLDSTGHYVFYPSSAAETYKMAYNSTTLISGLQVVLTKLLAVQTLDEGRRGFLKAMQAALPPVPKRSINGKQVLAPAETWSRIRNSEAPQLYPVYPWGIYGVGRPDLEIARNTWFYDPQVVQYRSHVGWRQYNIFAARLGMTDTAAAYALKKFANGSYRFPAFWGPGFDWSPDHNWGGSAMIGLQEMLMQDVDEKIYLLPAWPANWDVHFKLHAPGQTTVEAELKGGKLMQLKVIPENRRADIVLPDWLK